MKYYTGSGLLNSALNKLPLPELHLPGYNFCGPFTKLHKRLARGDKGINELDEACKDHDIAYSENKDLKHRHEADNILAAKAFARYSSRNASRGEKLAALGITGAMKAKVKFGMGYNDNNKKSQGNCLKIVKKCSKTMDKLKKATLKNIDNCINDLETLTQGKQRGVTTTNTTNKTKVIRSKTKKQMVNQRFPEPSPQPQPIGRLLSKAEIKRKFNINSDDDDMVDVPLKRPTKQQRRRVLPSKKTKMVKKSKTVNEKMDTIPPAQKTIKRKLNFDIEDVEEPVDVPFKKAKSNYENTRKKLVTPRKRRLDFSDDDNITSSKKHKFENILETPTRKRKLTVDDDENENLLNTPVSKKIKI